MELLLKSFVIALFVFNVWSVNRTYQSLQRQFSQDMLTKIGTILVCVWCFSLFVAFKNQKMFLIFLILGMFLPKTLKTYLRHVLKRQMNDKLLLFLNSLLLKMRIGFGFRSAFEQSIPEKRDVFTSKIKKVREFVVFSQQKVEFDGDETLFELFENLKYADTHPEIASTIIRNYKNKLQLLENFRRKSLQVTLNIRLQIAILGVLYGGMFCFSLFQFGFKGHERLFVSSLFLFGCGIFICVLLFRRWQWKT